MTCAGIPQNAVTSAPPIRRLAYARETLIGPWVVWRLGFEFVRVELGGLGFKVRGFSKHFEWHSHCCYGYQTTMKGARPISAGGPPKVRGDRNAAGAAAQRFLQTCRGLGGSLNLKPHRQNTETSADVPPG